MQLSTITKVVLGFAFGAIVGGGVMSSIANINDSSNTRLAELSRSDIRVSESTMPYCPPPPAGSTYTCPSPEQYQQMQQQYQQNQTQSPPPTGTQQPTTTTQPNTSGQYPTTQNPPPTDTQPPSTTNQYPNQYQPPAGQTDQSGQQPPTGTQPPPNGQQYPNQSQNQPGGQPGQPGQPNQPYPNQPYNAASTNIGPPPQLTFQQPAGLVNPDECFNKVGGPSLAAAVRSGKMLSTNDMIVAASCFGTNINAGPGQGQSGQNGPNGQPGTNGQGNLPFGRMTIFSDKFVQTMSANEPPAKKCVVDSVGEAVAEKMFNQGTPPDSATMEKINNARCFGQQRGSGNGQPGAPDREFPAPPPQVLACLNEKIKGNDAIQSGKRNPTPAELSAGQSCFQEANIVPSFFPHSELANLDPTSNKMMLCSQAVLGNDISTLTPDKLPREIKDKIRQCFKTSSDYALVKEHQPTLSQKTADCLKEAMGDETAFAQVSTGQLEPTAEQRKRGAVCFSKKNQSGLVGIVLAANKLPQAEALMTEVDTNLVREPTVIPPTTDEVTSNPDGASFVLAGYLGLETESAEIYINSDSAIVTADTEFSDGGKTTWNTKIAYGDLSPNETHTAYAVITKADGTYARSPMVTFVAKAVADNGTSTKGVSRTMQIVYGLLGVLILAAISALVIRRRHKQLAV